MDIIGSGFLARHLARIGGRHPDTVALAAGVSSTAATSRADFARETELVVETARRCRNLGRRLVFFSTSSAALYGRVDGAAREDDAVIPTNPYGLHKLALERRLLESGVRVLVLRLAHLVGPGQPAHQLLPTLTRLIRAGRVLVHKGATRDLIDIRDAVRILDLLLSQGTVSETVNVASGSSVPVEDIVDLLEKRLGVVAAREYTEGGLGHLVSVDKLRRLVPETAQFGFGPGYYRSTVDTFLRWAVADA